ncbi:hypothetical protein [Halorarius litoreus]|uniref:hypothetical protein n=1 Tax=Halorarius litoreus TaxID=2962676 RepID=UPI0020CD8D91|nr:hypothetical protein [Halorarius litoreus]
MGSILAAVRTGVNRSAIRTLSPLSKTLVAVGLYGVWTAVTWLLEGRIQTLLRPEATLDRVVYTGVANVLVGTVLALWVVREFVASDVATPRAFGFRTASRTAVGVLLAGVLGVAVYLLQQPPSTDPIVVLNAFAQVLPVSIAEVVVCWVVVGGSVAALLRRRGMNDLLANGLALVVASVLFGVYHVAHSPPFNTLEMVGLLTVVSVGTGLFYFGGGSVYGALVFHNFLALFGVTTALAEAGQLGTYQTPVVPLLATALVATVVLVAMDRVVVRRAARTPLGPEATDV